MWPDWPLEGPLPTQRLGMTPQKLPAGYSCTNCKGMGAHYSADCLVKAKANFSQAEIIAAVAAEFNNHSEAEQQAAETADWCRRKDQESSSAAPISELRGSGDSRPPIILFIAQL